jgi:hypothetical protein
MKMEMEMEIEGLLLGVRWVIHTCGEFRMRAEEISFEAE